MLKLLTYTAMFGMWAYALWWDIKFIPGRDPEHSWFRKLKFLTVINLLLTTIYVGLSLLRALVVALTGTKGRGHTRHPFLVAHDFFFYVIFALGWAVTILFWGLYAIDRELVFPKWMDRIVPSWLNHVIHTAPVFCSLLDSYLTCHKRVARKTGMICATLFTLAYVSSIFVWHAVEGFWVYPVFEVLDAYGKAAFIGAGIFLINFLFLFGDWLNGRIWGEHSVEGPSTHTSRKHR